MNSVNVDILRSGLKPQSIGSFIGFDFENKPMEKAFGSNCDRFDDEIDEFGKSHVRKAKALTFSSWNSARICA